MPFQAVLHEPPLIPPVYKQPRHIMTFHQTVTPIALAFQRNFENSNHRRHGKSVDHLGSRNCEEEPWQTHDHGFVEPQKNTEKLHETIRAQNMRGTLWLI